MKKYQGADSAMSPKISIVTPSYNQGKYLEETILSLLSQDYSNFEYLVMDGGSTDNSVEILERYSDRLTYWTSEPDDGQSDAICKGFERSTGDILGWVNSDDLLLPGALSAVAEYFQQHPTTNAVSCGAYLIDARGMPLNNLIGSVSLGYPASYNMLRYFGMGLVQQPATFWRREAYEQVGGLDKNLHIIMDIDLLTRLARDKPLGHLPRLVAAFRVHDECKGVFMPGVFEAEKELFAQRYGQARHGAVIRRSLYYYYRCVLLAAKLRLVGLRILGRLTLVTPQLPSGGR